jgi:hypothetical protein
MSNGIELSVRDKLPSRQSTTEARFEKRVAQILEELGLFSFHTSEKYIAGIPDRYVVGGNWIEFKVFPCDGRRRVNSHRLFEPEQKLYLRKLHESGDRTWVAIMFQPTNGDAYIVVKPWHALQETWISATWTIEGVRAKSDCLHGYIQERFNSHYPRFSHAGIYNADH